MDTRDNGQPLGDGNIEEQIACMNQRLATGDILRYHTAPQVGQGQTVGQHTWRGLVLLDMIWPSAPMQIWRYFLYHDAAELFTGDIPSPIKWSNKALQEIIAELEEDICDKMGLPSKTDFPRDEQLLVEMIDVLELMFHCNPLRKTIAKAEEIYQAGYEKVWKLSVQLEMILRKSKENMAHQERARSLLMIRKLLDEK